MLKQQANDVMALVGEMREQCDTLTTTRAIQSYKNRLNRLREALNNLMSRYHKLDQNYK